VREKAELK